MWNNVFATFYRTTYTNKAIHGCDGSAKIRKDLWILLILVVDGPQTFQFGALLLVAQQWDIVVEGIEESLGLTGLLGTGNIGLLLVDVGLDLLLGGLIATLLLVLGGIRIGIVSSGSGQFTPQLEVLLLGLQDSRRLGGRLLEMRRTVVLHMETGLIGIVVGHKVTAMRLDILVRSGYRARLIALLVLSLVPVPVTVGKLTQTILTMVLMGIVVLLHKVLGMFDHTTHVHELSLLVASLGQRVLAGFRGILYISNAPQLGAIQELLSLLGGYVDLKDVLATGSGGLK